MSLNLQLVFSGDISVALEADIHGSRGTRSAPRGTSSAAGPARGMFLC